MAMPPVLYFFRHGETEFNAQDRVQGFDVPLNDVGRSQAAQCGKILGELLARDGKAAADLDYVSSPLCRAQQTMELARPQLSLPPDGYRLERKLTEMSFGAWENATWAELNAREPDAVAGRDRDRWHVAPPDGESYEHLLRRVSGWYRTVKRDSVVCSHGAVARALMVHLDAMTRQEAMLHSVGQGVVYVFAGGRLTQYP